MISAASAAAFVLVDKAGGWTSHDVVAKLRGELGIKKVGHAGTLDPMATGLLVLGVGRATRLLRYVQDAPKTYVATARFGVATESLDADGGVLSREPMPVSEKDVVSAMTRFVRTILQVPPMVSALKVEGRRLYSLARDGKTVEREPRPVTIYELRITDFAPSDYPEVSFEVKCSKGTYVRTLADDMARALGGRAHLTSLRRTTIGSLAVGSARSIDDIVAADSDEFWHNIALSPSSGLADLPAVEVGADLVGAVSNGVAIAGRRLGDPEDGPLRMLDEHGSLLAVYRASGSRAAAEVVLS